jgi:hypothetical protein
MTSESTRFFGQPKETKPIFGRTAVASGEGLISVVARGVTVL